MQFSNDNVTWAEVASYSTTTTWTLSAGDGTKTVYAKFKDSAGNWSTVSSDTIILDTTPPTGSITIDGGAPLANTAAAILTLSASDANGVSQMQFSNDNVTWAEVASYSTTTTWTLSAGDGTKTVYAKFKDDAGNWSTTYSKTIILDSVAPTGTITINGGASTTNAGAVTLTLPATDANGVSQLQFSNDNVTWSTPEAYLATKTWSLTPGNGTKTVYVKFKDNAGNWSGAYSATIILAGLPDAITALSPTGTGILTTAPFTFKAVAGATGYQIYVYDYITATGSLTNVTPTQAGCASGTCSYTPASPFTDGHSYGWHVAAQNELGQGAWSNALSFNVGATPAAIQGWVDSFDPNANNQVTVTIIQPLDGKVISAGTFTMLGGATRNYIGRVNIDGTLDTTFNPNPNGVIHAVAVQSDGKILVGGNFTNIGGGSITNIARLNSDGSLDTSFTASMPTGVPSSSIPSAIMIQSNGQILIADNYYYTGYVVYDDCCNDGGGCTSWGDPENISNAHLFRLNSNGSVDTSFYDFVSNGSDSYFCRDSNTGQNSWSSTFNAIAIQVDGTILVGGSFDVYNGLNNLGLSKILSNGVVDPTFNAIVWDSSGPNGFGTISSLAIQSNGQVLFGGKFDSVLINTSSSINSHNIGRLNSNDILDTSFIVSSNNTVNSLLIQPDGNILAGGLFTTLGGQTANYIGRLNSSNGSLDTTFNANANGPINSMALDAAGNVVVSGAFTSFGAQTRNRIGRLASSGGQDTNGPTGSITINSGAAATNSTTVILTLVATDTSGVFQMKFSNDNTSWSAAEPYAATKNWTLLVTDGTKTVYAKFQDNAGNWSTAYSATIVLETVAPTGWITINNNFGYTNNTLVTLRMSAADSGSGVSQMQFSNDGTTWSAAEPYAETKTWTLTTGDGTKCVYYRFKDNAGNWSAADYAWIVLDTVAPTGTITINGGAAFTNTSTVTLTLGNSDADGFSFSNDGTTWSTLQAFSPTKTWTLTPGEGIKTVYAKFWDDAGNWSAAFSATIVVETNAPTGGITVNDNASTTSNNLVTLTLDAADSLSGLSQMQFSNDNATWSTAEAYAPTKSWTLSDGDGTKTVYVKFKNNAENWSAAYTDTIMLDTALPTGSIKINGGATLADAAAVTLTLNASDANGVSQMQFSNDNSTWSTAEAYAPAKAWTLTDGDGTKIVYVKFQDNAGYWSTVYSTTIVLDTLSYVTVSRNTIDTSASESTTILCPVIASRGTPTITLKMSNLGGSLVYSTSQACPSPGCTFVWDGKNNSNSVVSDGAYVYTLEGSDGVNYNPTAPATGTINCSQSGTYNAFRNEPLTINYDLGQNAKVNLSMTYTDWYNATLNLYKSVVIASNLPQLAGSHSYIWDGRDSSGNAAPAANGTLECSLASLLSENIIMTSGNTPQITNVKTDPYAIDITYGQFTRIQYNLSQASSVTVQLAAPLGSMITLLSNQPQTAGAHEVKWSAFDTVDFTGIPLQTTASGSYTVWITATNPATGGSSTARGSLQIGL